MKFQTVSRPWAVKIEFHTFSRFPDPVGTLHMASLDYNELDIISMAQCMQHCSNSSAGVPAVLHEAIDIVIWLRK